MGTAASLQFNGGYDLKQDHGEDWRNFADHAGSRSISFRIRALHWRIGPDPRLSHETDVNVAKA